MILAMIRMMSMAKSAVHQVQGEHHSSSSAKSNHLVFASGKESQDDTSNDQDDEHGKECGTTPREVDLGLECEQSEAQGDASGDTDSNEDSIDLIEGGDGSEHAALAQGEHSEDHEVVRKCSADTLTAGEDNHTGQRHAPGGPHEPSVLLNKSAKSHLH